MKLKDFLLNLKPADFVESVTTGGKVWDIYRKNVHVVAFRHDGCRVVIGALGRTVEEVKDNLTKDQS